MNLLRSIRHITTVVLGKGDESELSRYAVVKKFTERLYPKFKLSSFGRIFLEDEDFLAYYRKYASTLDFSSLDRRYMLDQLAKHAMTLGGGDTAECGVFRGASSYLICQRIQGTGRLHFLFDSFEGISVPTDEDCGCAWGAGEFACSEEQVHETLREFSCAQYYKGWIPDRFDEVSERTFSFVHIDVDLYQPTLDSLVFFYPRMVPGGIILCDDYGMRQAPGAKKAMDDFFVGKQEVIMSLPTGQGLVIKSWV